MCDGVSLTPAQVHELDRLHAEVAEAWSRMLPHAKVYEDASARMLGRLAAILEAAGVPEEERTKPREWRMVVEGDAVRLVPADGDGDGHVE